MSEQVKRFMAPTNDTCDMDSYQQAVLATDYDALHAEAEALRAENGRLRPLAEDRDQQYDMKAKARQQRDEMRAQLEAARGLLERVHDGLEKGYPLIKTAEKIRAFLTAAPSTEVQAEQGERQEALPLFTCSGKGGEYAKLGYAKPAGAIKAIQGDSGLIVYRDTKSGQLYFRDPRDFNDRMSPLAVMEPCSLGGDVIRQRTTADTTPQPGPDVRGLAAFALELIDGAGEGGSFDGGDIQEAGVRHGLLVIEERQEKCGEHCACVECGFPAECYRLTPALAAHRQAQIKASEQ